MAFLRILMEYSKWFWPQLSVEYRLVIDNLIPTFEDYE